jgi:hypothetical protein
MKKLLALLIIACSALHGTIFIAGRNDLSQATLWITDSVGTLIKTTPLDKEGSEAFNCMLVGSDVYICGFNSNNNPSLWITDLFGTLKLSIPLSDQQGLVLNFAQLGNNIYMVGKINKQGILWIVNTVSKSVTPKIIESATSAYDLSIYQNKLYIVGKTHKLDRLFITDLSVNIIAITDLWQLGSRSFAISADNSRIYLLGDEYYKSPTSTLIQTNLEGNILKQINLGIVGSADQIISKSSNNYMLSSFGLYIQPIAELNSVPYPLLIPNIDEANWFYFQLKNSSTYIVGADSLARATLFMYDSSGALKKVTKLSNEGSLASGMSILEPLDAFKKFSPTSFQRGLCERL